MISITILWHSKLLSTCFHIVIIREIIAHGIRYFSTKSTVLTTKIDFRNIQSNVDVVIFNCCFQPIPSVVFLIVIHSIIYSFIQLLTSIPVIFSYLQSNHQSREPASTMYSSQLKISKSLISCNSVPRRYYHCF